MTQTTQDTTHLDELRFGHEHPGALNSRKFDRDADLPALMASIQAHGLLSPLIVKGETDGKLYVLDGNRRLAALRALAGEELLDEEFFEEIPIIVRGETDAQAAREISLAANVQRLPLHPVDQYEAFADLAGGGLDAGAIAQRFGIKEKLVRQALALGGLSPVLRAAWRKGEIKADTAQVFTLTNDHKAQERAYAAIRKRGARPSPWNVRQELFGKKEDVAAELNFIGLDAYRAAGGQVIEDLFEGEHVASDPALAKRLAQEKIEAECKRLVEQEGWAWALPLATVKNRWDYGQSQAKGKPTEEEKTRLAELGTIMDRVRGDTDDDEDPDWQHYDAAEAEMAEINQTIAARGYSERQKKAAGCFVAIGAAGNLEIEYGRIKPAAKAKPAPQAKEKKKTPEAEPVISGALAQRLSIQLTQATAAALANAPELGVDVCLAALLTDPHGQVMLGVLQGRGGDMALGDDFAGILETVREWDADRKTRTFARIAAAALNFERFNTHAPAIDRDAAAIIGALPAAMMTEALGEAFDAEDYFNAVSKEIILAALEEMRDENAPKISAGKKSEIAGLAAGRAKHKGWLPPELRTVHYTGPGADPAPAAAGRGAPNQTSGGSAALAAAEEPSTKPARKKGKAA